MIVIGTLLTVGVLALAFAYGGRAERGAAWVILAGLATSIGLGAVFGLHQQVPIALADLVLIAGFALLAIRHGRVWLYAEVGLAFMLTVAQVISDQPFGPSLPFRLLVNGINVVGLLTLVVAVFAHKRRVRPEGMRVSQTPRRPDAGQAPRSMSG